MPLQEGQRVAYSPAEFSALFGKSQTWGYRQVYAGTVAVVTQRGRILIPASEVERLLRSAGIYKGREDSHGKRKRKKLSKNQLGLWERFIKAKKDGAKLERGEAEKTSRKRPRWNSDGNRTARKKLVRRWAGG